MALVTHESYNQFNDRFPGIAISIQRTTKTNDFLPPHWHERMEVWGIKEGTMTISCDGDIFDVQAGDVLIINPGQVHSCRVTKAPATVDCMIIDCNILLTNRPGETDQTLRNIAAGKLRFQHIIRKNPNIYPLVQQMVACTPTTSLSNMEITGLLYQLISLLARHYVFKAEHTVPRHLQEINQLLEYIHTHYQTDLTLTSLAAKACRSPAHLCRWFKDAVGESPMAYLTTVRINKAYELLISGKYSVSAACRAVGIWDLNTFTRQFKKRVGVSPSKIKTEK